MPKSINTLILIVLFGTLLYAGVYFWGSHSEAFRFIERTIMNSRAVQSQIGNVERVRLAPFSTYHEKSASDDVWVTMGVNVTGTRKTVTIDVKAKKIRDVWQIEQASIDGKPLLLN